uniref:Uncharacterized protein n=1 Tax=Proboscia inermis TaxID=420281 RepID=A0A7S0GIX8_9STRA|mmetsp:Transcript_41581/g.42198  ORF Transcript_41581/g.42198 Transcript_41581/m.42198 type:complete len:250 (+) Transcript_41581:47-796(+)
MHDETPMHEQLSIDGERLNLPAHVTFIETATAGRTLVTTEPISRGAIALEGDGFAHTIHRRFKHRTCEHCFRFASFAEEDGDGGTKTPCSLTNPCPKSCGVYFCSDSCYAAGIERHETICGLLLECEADTKRADGNKRNKKKNGGSKAKATELSLLMSMTSHPGSHHHRMEMMDILLILVKDSSPKVRRDTMAAEATFRKLNNHQRPLLESKGVYAAALSTKNPNAFGIYNEYGEEIGCIFCPVVAMVK